jgi:hypothetical protein
MTKNAINPRRQVIKFPVVQLQMLVDFRIVMTSSFVGKLQKKRKIG